jgi:hypothetical protein
MASMRGNVISTLPRGRVRDQRVPRAIAARRRLEGRRGRAWINGREVGGVDPRFAHLAGSYD